MAGQAAVLWRNSEYNSLYRAWQRDFYAGQVAEAPPKNILDIGCGIGVVARMLVDLVPSARVDAVDFPEMIDVARRENPADGITYHPAPAEDFVRPEGTYDWIVSSSCYSMIHDNEKRLRAMAQGAQMLAPGGRLILIDPFHRYAYLRRAPMGADEVIRFFQQRGLHLALRSGVLFWPFREYLSSPDLTVVRTRRLFALGERMLRILGPRFWSDYKVLVFAKSSTH